LSIYTDEIFIASGWPIFCNGETLVPLFTTVVLNKVSPKKKWEGKLVLLKRENVCDPCDHTPYGSHIFVNFPTTTVLQNKPALSARARAAQRAIYWVLIRRIQCKLMPL